MHSVREVMTGLHLLLSTCDSYLFLGMQRRVMEASA